MATISKITAEKGELQQEIQDLKKAIADNLTALNEPLSSAVPRRQTMRPPLRTNEGKIAFELAINIIKEFYDNAFIQTGKYVLPNAEFWHDCC